MAEQRQADSTNGLVGAFRVHDAVGGGGEVAPRGFLQHVADVDDQVAEITGNLQPRPIFCQNL